MCRNFNNEKTADVAKSVGRSIVKDCNDQFGETSVVRYETLALQHNLKNH